MSNIINKEHLYILFSDIKGFSRLSEEETEKYSNIFIPHVSERITALGIEPIVWNTWGDALFAAIKDPNKMLSLAFAYRDIFTDFDFTQISQSLRLMPRIACNFGEVTIIHDSMLNKKNIFGYNVNSAARLEPVTRPGEIFVTEEFKIAIERSPSASKNQYKFDEVGSISLAKNFGIKKTYRLRRCNEPEQAIDWLSAINLTKTLPTPDLSSQKINYELFQNCTQEFIRNMLSNTLNTQPITGGDIFQAVKLYQSSGLYEEAINTIDLLESYQEEVDSIKIYPYRSIPEVAKIKANSYTRIGKYEEAANAVYSLWASGHEDADTLCMIAAQYKRRAIYGISNEVQNIEKIDEELLFRARDLYLEALRIDLDNYYAAINAAYLIRIYHAIKKAPRSGIKLAAYIGEAWKKREGESWWLDATLAEAEILQEEVNIAQNMLSKAIELHRPTVFQITATYEQINIFAKLTGQQSPLGELLRFLEAAIRKRIGS